MYKTKRPIDLKEIYLFKMAAAVAWVLVFFPVDIEDFIARLFPHFAICGDVSQPKYPRRTKQFKSAFVCGQYNVPLICTFFLPARTILLWPLLC